MPMAIELFLDHDADARVRSAWARLDEHGVPSLATNEPAAVYRPHVSLALFDDVVDPDPIGDACRAVTSAADRLPLVLPALGFFLTDEAPAFLSVTATSRLLDLHRRVAAAIRPHVTGSSPYYEPDALLFHCTLAIGVRDPAAVLRALDGFTLPVLAEGVGLHLVDVLTGAVLLDLWQTTTR